MTWDQYKDGTRDVLYLEPAGNQFIDLRAVVEYVKSPQFDKTRHLMLLSQSKGYRSNGRAIPASFSLPVDKAKVLANGTVAPKDSALIVDKLQWNMSTTNVNPLAKAYIIMMDILANNNWERPIYFASTTGSEAYLGLEDYFQLEGFAYRLVPIKTPRSYDIGRVNTDRLYDNLMNVFMDHSRADRVNNPKAPAKEAYPYAWGGFNDPRVYHSEDNARLVSLIRGLYSRLASQLLAEGKTAEAEKVLDKGNEVLPDTIFPYVSTMSNMYGYTQRTMFYMQDYFRLKTASANEKGMKMANDIFDEEVELFNWYNNCDERTLDIQSDNIHYDFLFLHYLLNNIDYPDNSLLKRCGELKLDKVAMSYAKNLSAAMSKMIRKPDFDQQTLAGSFQELHQIAELAQMSGSAETAKAIDAIANTQLSSLDAISREMGQAFRSFYQNIGRMADAEADTATTEEPQQEQQ